MQSCSRLEAVARETLEVGKESRSQDRALSLKITHEDRVENEQDAEEPCRERTADWHSSSALTARMQKPLSASEDLTKVSGQRTSHWSTSLPGSSLQSR